MLSSTRCPGSISLFPYFRPSLWIISPPRCPSSSGCQSRSCSECVTPSWARSSSWTRTTTAWTPPSPIWRACPARWWPTWRRVSSRPARCWGTVWPAPSSRPLFTSLGAIATDSSIGQAAKSPLTRRRLYGRVQLACSRSWRRCCSCKYFASLSKSGWICSTQAEASPTSLNLSAWPLRTGPTSD